MDWPDVAGINDMPDWLLKEINYKGTYYTTSVGTKGFSPDYRDPILLQAHERFIRAFAARYDNDKTFQIKLGSLGHWGELHTTFIKDLSAAGTYPKADLEAKYLEHYCKYFTKTTLSSRRPVLISNKYKMTMYNHSLGNTNQVYRWFLDWANNGYYLAQNLSTYPATPDYWINGAVGAEIPNYPYTAYLQDNTINSLIQQARDIRLSWLLAPPETALTDTVRKNMDKLLSKIGYRIVVSSLTFSKSIVGADNLNVNMRLRNTGVAACHFEWPLEISLLDSNGVPVYSVRKTINTNKWIPGEKALSYSLALPDTLPDGTYKLALAIVDIASGQPAVKFAINAPEYDLRYVMGEINVNRKENDSISVYGAETVAVPSNGITVKYGAYIKLSNGGNLPAADNCVWSIENNPGTVSIDSTGTVFIPAENAGKSFSVNCKALGLECSLSVSTIALTSESKQYIGASDNKIIDNNSGLVLQASDLQCDTKSKLVFARASWSELEPVSGEYAFESFEKRINYAQWVERGYRFIFKFYLDHPDNNNTPDLPVWLQKKLGTSGTFYKNANGAVLGFSPQYSSQIMRNEHSKFIAALADRYNNASTYNIQVGTLGHWGNMETSYITNVNAAGAYPEQNVESMYLSDYSRNFTEVMISVPFAREPALNGKMGMYLNNLGSEFSVKRFVDYLLSGYTHFISKYDYPSYPDYARYNPVIAELSGWPNYSTLIGNALAATKAQIVNAQVSYLIAPPMYVMNNEVLQGLREVEDLLGAGIYCDNVEYSAQAADLFKLKINFGNSGTAPGNAEYLLKLRLYDEKGGLVTSYSENFCAGDIHTNGASFMKEYSIPPTLKDGDYFVKLAFENKMSQRLELKMSNGTDLEYPLFRFTVNRNNTINIVGPSVVSRYKNISARYEFQAVIINSESKAINGPVTWSIETPQSGVSIDNMGILTVTPQATATKVTVVAASQLLKSRFTVSIK